MRLARLRGYLSQPKSLALEPSRHKFLESATLCWRHLFHGCQMFSLLREKMVGEFLHRRSQKDSITRLNHLRLKSIVPTAPDAYFGDRTLKKRSLMSITNHWERRFFGAIERGEPSFELYRVGK